MALVWCNFAPYNTPLKVDFSANDVITPREMPFAFRLSFEDRTIPVLAYNLETILSEKLETLLSRSTANTRMRDFYDIHVLINIPTQCIDNWIGYTKLYRKDKVVVFS